MGVEHLPCASFLFGKMQNSINQLTILYQKGHFEAGEKLAKNILASDPNNPYANHFLGLKALKNDDLNTAIFLIKKSIEFLPNNVHFYCNLGEVYFRKKQYEKALSQFKQAIIINPEHANAYYQSGILFQSLNNPKKAIECYQNCLKYQPKHVEALYNANLAYQASKQYTEAINCCQKIVQIEMNHHKAWNDMGVACHKSGQYSLAENCFDKSLAIESSSALAHENRAVLKLLVGDYLNGFIEYQWFRKQIFDRPLDLSSQIHGKRILVYSERGFGDIIQFVRYLPLLRKENAFVILQTPRELFRLFSLSQITDQCDVNTSKKLPSFDFDTGMMFLPCFFKTNFSTIPSKVPYLIPPEAIKRPLDEAIQNHKAYFNIGIVWAGNAQNENDAHRSTSVEFFLSIARLPGVRLFSFQKDSVHRDFLNRLPDDVSITDIGFLFEDFADTATAIQKMDMMICVETSVAHLSGALGHPTWLLLPKIPDWRWFLDKKNSPWYPSMKLFRQKNDGHWKDVFLDVKNELIPVIVDHFYQKGISLLNRKQYAQACHYFGYMTQLNPDYFEAWFQLGNTYVAQKHINQGIECYEKAVTLEPGHATCHYNLGRSWYSQREYKNAVKHFLAAIEIDPSYYKAIYNLGSAYYRTREIEKSIDAFQKAMIIKPDQIDIYTNLGACYGKCGDLEKAISWHQKAIKMSPDYADAHYNMGISLLLAGRLREGFKKYEWRLKRSDFPQPGYNSPLWDGRILNHQVLLVYMEQGFGDAIQFIRYLPQVKSRVKKVILVCHPSVVRLFETAQGIDLIIPENYPLPSFDFHISLLSLPYIFETSLDQIPNQTPYLSAPYEIPTALKDMIDLNRKTFNVGFVWAGNPSNKHDQDRSVPSYMFSSIASLEHIQLFSLQKQNTPSNYISLFDYIDLSPYLNDFSDTAFAISQLDLVISVDTAVVHLAGALKNPVWILLSKIPDWRWMMNRSDSPWYPSAKLFRQKIDGIWTDVFTNVMNELKAMTSDQSENYFCSDITPSPYLADQLLKQGNSYFRNNQLDEAIQKYKESLSIQPDCAETLYNIGVVYLKCDQPDKAIGFLNHVIELQPDHDQAYNNLGIACQKLDQTKRAIDYFQKAIDIKPESQKSLYNLGNALKNDQQFEKAIHVYHKAITIQPNFPECLNNLADIYIYQERYDDAMKLVDHALDNKSTYPELYFNKGVILSRLGEYEKAITYLRKAIVMRPRFVDAHYSLCFCLLILGQFTEGFEKHEWRIAKSPAQHQYGLKRWRGESFEGQTLLVYCEQGYGDCIHFVRYLPLIKPRGGEIVLGCSPELYPLFVSLKGVDKVIMEGDNFPNCDFQVSLLSLPFLCSTTLSTIPNEIPYIISLKNSHQHIDPIISLYNDFFRVGIVWAGSPTHKNDKERSIPFQMFQQLADINNIRIFSFQKKGFSQECQQMNWIDLGVYFDDFSDTAYAAKQMNLIITVDTSVAHLSGAMGLPTWVLIPPVPDWRWLLNRDDNPWYPTIRLFRKKRHEDWKSVFDRVVDALSKITHRSTNAGA
jgi:tetratricopeptide (TPR) repeat protein